MNNFETEAAELDKADQLAPFKKLFKLPANTVYLDGNSLGPLLKSTQTTVSRVIEQQWGNELVSSWNSNGWIDLPSTTGAKIASLIGAERGQVICCDSISINLFKVLHSALQLNPDRHLILSQTGNFPTDLYAAQGLQQLLGENRCKLVTTSEDNIESALSTDVAVLLLTQVDFRTGKLHDIEKITRTAHAQGTVVVWDLAHSTGVLPLYLDDWKVDFAVGCGYKYLNGGPGAPAFIYAAKRHHSKFTQPLQGWMGHMAPFDFSEEYAAGKGMQQFLTGTPQIISMSALSDALDLFENVSIADVRNKSIQLTKFFDDCKTKTVQLDELQLISPINPAQRGSQLAYSHPFAFNICQNLIALGVIADFRSPDVLRLGFSPLFLSFADIEQSLSTLCSIIESKSYLDERFSAKQKVT